MPTTVTKMQKHETPLRLMQLFIVVIWGKSFVGIIENFGLVFDIFMGNKSLMLMYYVCDDMVVANLQDKCLIKFLA